jgi:hypothetical protein
MRLGTWPFGWYFLRSHCRIKWDELGSRGRKRGNAWTSMEIVKGLWPREIGFNSGSQPDLSSIHHNILHSTLIPSRTYREPELSLINQFSLLFCTTKPKGRPFSRTPHHDSTNEVLIIMHMTYNQNSFYPKSCFHRHILSKSV